MAPAVVLLERLARELGMTRGSWRLEARFSEGRLREVYRHEERIPVTRLGGFGETPAGRGAG